MNNTSVKLTPRGIAVAEKCKELTNEYIKQAEEYNTAHNTNISWRLFKLPWYSMYLSDPSVCVNVELEKAQGTRPVYMLGEDDKPIVKKPRGKGKSKDIDETEEETVDEGYEYTADEEE